MEFVLKYLFIGAVNENNSPQGGEEYKNQLILSKLKSELIDLQYIDTIYWKKSPLLFFRLFYNLFFKYYDNIVISASSISTYRLFKIIYFIQPRILSKISYLVIGGYFPVAIENGTFKVQFYQNLKCIIVEGNILKTKLEFKLSKVPLCVIPNFKKFPVVVNLEVVKYEFFRFIFLGRISEPKGVGAIIEASKLIKKHLPNLTFTVDFFGPLEENFKFDHICRYQGYLDFTLDNVKSYHKLNSYNCFLFPTTWKGEGFPGVIIDAYIAGLPVIATDWNMNSEIIKDGINGFIIPPNDIQALADKMVWVMNNLEESRAIGKNNKLLSKNFHIDEVWNKLYTLIK
jgi:glycosyltransferase involved in cell wall biosynthesis